MAWTDFLNFGSSQDGVDAWKGNEQSRISSLLKGGAGTLEGLFADEEERKRMNQELALKKAELQQSYLNSLPAQMQARQQARQRASTLASLAGLF